MSWGSLWKGPVVEKRLVETVFFFGGRLFGGHCGRMMDGVVIDGKVNKRLKISARSREMAFEKR